MKLGDQRCIFRTSVSNEAHPNKLEDSSTRTPHDNCLRKYNSPVRCETIV
jgi:hypothetical protein